MQNKGNITFTGWPDQRRLWWMEQELKLLKLVDLIESDVFVESESVARLSKLREQLGRMLVEFAQVYDVRIEFL